MLIFDEHSKATLIDNICGPLVTEHMWILDWSIMDFKLVPLVMLEELVCPSMQVCINGFEFVLPANWNILIFDRETAQLDVVELSEAAGREFTAFIYGPNKSRHSGASIIVTNYFVEYKNVGPSLNKHQMLCCPISSDEWISVSPSDSYSKYLKNSVIGDLMG